MTRNCAGCEVLGQDPRATQNTIAVHTVLPGLTARAQEQLAAEGAERHVIVHICPEHVVDVYRDRVAGVQMAWRMASVVG